MKLVSRFITTIFLLLIISAFSLQAEPDIRIISLVPSQTELLYHLGLGDLIVGTSDYCNYPPEADKTVKVGALELNIERIMSLRPSMLLDVNNMHKKYAPLFAQLGLNYVNFKVNRLEQLPQMAKEICEMVGKPDKGIKFNAEWQGKIAEMAASTSDNRPTVYFEIWDTPLQAAGSNSYIGDIIRASGGKNALADSGDFPVVNPETIIKADPDIIVVAYPLPDLKAIGKRPGWQSLRAIKNRQIFALNQDIFIRPGPRNLAALEELGKICRGAADIRKKDTK